MDDHPSMSDYLRPLDRWAATLNASGLVTVTPEALYNSRKLGIGRLSLAIVLIKPCNSHDISYKKIVHRSDTTRELDCLLYASDKRCSHLDVTILDIKPLVSGKMRKRLAGQERERNLNKHHGIFEQILLFKKPDVILTLQCQTKDAESPMVRSLCGFVPDYQGQPLYDCRTMRLLSFVDSI